MCNMADQLIDKWGEWIDVSGLTAGDSDVYCTFKGKRINLTVLYGEMMDDIVTYIQRDEFLSDKSDKNVGMSIEVCKYTTNKYGFSIEAIYNRMLNNDKVIVELTNDLLFQLMIDRVGGIEKIDWMWIFNKTSKFRTDNESILIYIANEILKGDIYKYFIDRFNFRVDSVKTKMKFYKKKNKNYKVPNIVFKWEVNGINKEKEIHLGKLKRNKRDWWQDMTKDSANRTRIADYDKLLNKRDENEVLPNRCPIDNNIILNYTGIDFSGGNQNFDECKNNVGSNETWSAASIDRIDSIKEYDYDNIQIISQYYNTMVKNCANVEQITKLYNHQTKLKSELYPIEYMI